MSLEHKKFEPTASDIFWASLKAGGRGSEMKFYPKTFGEIEMSQMIADIIAADKTALENQPLIR